MSLYILDTDTLSLIQHSSPVVLLRRTLAKQSGHALGLSTISVEEQFRGWQKRLNGAKTPAAYANASALFAQAVQSWGTFAILPETESSRSLYQHLVGLKLNVGKTTFALRPSPWIGARRS